MEVIVLGSGVVGLTSAWFLRQAGHDVTVIDRQPRSAEETSFANAGQISYGYSSPWAAPGIPTKAIKWLMQKHAPFKVQPSASPELYRWAAQMLVNCSYRHYQVNKSRMLRIANYSRDCLIDLRKSHDLNYEGRQQGTLQVFRTEAQLEAVKKDIEVLAESGTRFEEMDVAGCIAVEPGLEGVKHKLVGGLRLPDDETGDCYLFCQQLTDMAEKAGVKFLFNTQVERLVEENGQIRGVHTDKGLLKADNYVVAMGSFSPQLLSPMGIKLPVYPVKGYSLTMPVTNESEAPVSTVMDETYKVAMTRFDDRIRVAGTAELAGFNYNLPQKRKETIAMVISDLFPNGGDISKAEYWTGLRPMTPDGTPIIGKTHIKNLYTNTGHGTLGWTMACGSARLLADIVSGKQTDIDSTGLDVSRYAN
ncbi:MULTISPECIES: D-amino acid dehydrogenase [Photobacterium]|uniref:D-amino acid dehydrogenase n=1 Tax=Photobacterium ganghwense TaxID=320778 RepID=A0A0J1H9D3_9GAMM|nr:MULTISPECIES: D-amino acid dehydrogenase [Photobacterium]KLV08291.1 amino acid dehydrogenase [Photobacterium ganghwense]MBV1842760.1 D-amino acid dehydrogenase [Photobacterium ganghwense]PSU07426.1 D-amino acid dehydrogenase small subunit [Photobacterium ganghwense]QSV16166.1 D-amino acid dehydrogenase [Photobacterium ganghwense]